MHFVQLTVKFPKGTLRVIKRGWKIPHVEFPDVPRTTPCLQWIFPLPSGKRSQKTMENHHAISWVNPQDNDWGHFQEQVVSTKKPAGKILISSHCSPLLTDSSTIKKITIIVIQSQFNHGSITIYSGKIGKILISHKIFVDFFP